MDFHQTWFVQLISWSSGLVLVMTRFHKFLTELSARDLMVAGYYRFTFFLFFLWCFTDWVREPLCKPNNHFVFFTTFEPWWRFGTSKIDLNLLLLNTTCPVLANSSTFGHCVIVVLEVDCSILSTDAMELDDQNFHAKFNQSHRLVKMFLSMWPS